MADELSTELAERKEKKIAKINKLKEKKMKILEIKKEKALAERDLSELKHEIRSIKSEYSFFWNRVSKFSTSKLLTYVIIINVFVLEVIILWLSFVLADLSALPYLIPAVITQSITFAIYCIKSHKGKLEGGKLDLEREKIDFEEECFEVDMMKEDGGDNYFTLNSDEEMDISPNTDPDLLMASRPKMASNNNMRRRRKKEGKTYDKYSKIFNND